MAGWKILSPPTQFCINMDSGVNCFKVLPTAGGRSQETVAVKPMFLRGEWADANEELIASFSLSAVLTKRCFCALCKESEMDTCILSLVMHVSAVFISTFKKQQLIASSKVCLQVRMGTEDKAAGYLMHDRIVLRNVWMHCKIVLHKMRIKQWLMVCQLFFT